MSGPPTVAAILLAAGRSERMAGIDKTIVPLGGRPLAAWSVEAFASCSAVGTIMLVSGEQNQNELERIAAQYGAGKVAAVVAGGARRQDSVANGLRALPDDAGALVAVHDCARPLVSEALIERGIELAALHGAAIAAARVHDTIKRVEDDVIRETIERDTLRAVQTPQVFQRALLEMAHAATIADTESNATGATDDALLVEAIGHAVYVYEAEGPNLKVTTPDDLLIAEALLPKRLAERPAGSRQ